MAADSLMVALGHAFGDRDLLRTALTHRSFGAPNNERLEFIGDGILNCVIGLALYRRFPDVAEGELTRMRASLVRREALQRIAASIGLAPHLRLGDSEIRGGGAGTPSMLADTVEALIGAVYLDSGFEAASAVIGRLYLPLFDELKTGAASKDPKTRLQEWLQARKRPLPRYEVLEVTGSPPQQRFVVACSISAHDAGARGEGGSRRAAEQAAAEQALKALNA